MNSRLPKVRVTEIGEYIRHHSCDRRFKLEFDGRAATRNVPFAGRFYNSIDPILERVGRQKEDEWEKTLRDANFQVITPHNKDTIFAWEDFVGALDLSNGANLYAREVAIEGEIEGFFVSGQMDFVLIRWIQDKPQLWIVEAKASRRDRTYHRIQVTLYKMLVKKYLEQSPISIGYYTITSSNIECVVVRIDEQTNQIQSLLGLEPLGSMEREEADIARLLDPKGPFNRILRTDLDNLEYQLEAKCDGCVFNVHCFPESARQRRIELLGLEPSIINIFQQYTVSNIDKLAELNLTGHTADLIRTHDSFTENLEALSLRAQARRQTLPGSNIHPDEFEIQSLPHTGYGQLPLHELDGHRLVRIFLSVDYDYVENRLVGLSAHVTSSAGRLQTPFSKASDGKWSRDPNVVEITENQQGNKTTQQLSGKEVIRYITSEWTGNYDTDTGKEGELIQGFFYELVEAIAAVARAQQAPIHFYVWSKSEITSLVEACSRVDSRLLYHLRQLLGCRDRLDQLIFSSLQDEVTHRYATGWTSTGLVVISTLGWYGETYHWHREVNGNPTDLDHVFTQDIFDFKTDLYLEKDNTWSKSETGERHKFEIRGRFYDYLTAPYWRAIWRTLPGPEDVDKHSVKQAIRRYQRCMTPGYLPAYLTARLHALRWIEERIRFKNRDIVKPLVEIADLPNFDLNVTSTARAAIDFLILDHHIKSTNWLASHLIPPINRVSTGQTIPIKNLVNVNNDELRCEIDLDHYQIDVSTLSSRCGLRTGSFVRVSPYDGNPHNGQSIFNLYYEGLNCRLDSVDWDSGEIYLKVFYSNPTTYVYPSRNTTNVDFPFATIDEGITDYVSGRVQERLSAMQNNPVYDWLDPENPQVPASLQLNDNQLRNIENWLDQLTLPNGQYLADDQKRAVLDGLNTRIHLLQGPPGTGKTMTTAVAIIVRILLNYSHGGIIVLAANTHSAVNNLLLRLDSLIDHLADPTLPSIRLMKIHSANIEEPLAVGNRRIEDISANKGQVTRLNRLLNSGTVIILASTTGTILKLNKNQLENKSTFNTGRGLVTSLLIIDEASMIVFPHFLSLATFLDNDGQIMLAGDHRQLSPIVSHDWEGEDRPPVVLYQPYVSAYQAIVNLSENSQVAQSAIGRSALRLSFRLPPVIIDLIARLYRNMDNIELQGLSRPNSSFQSNFDENSSWEAVWQGTNGLFLVLHSESGSQRSNRVELEIIRSILEADHHLPSESVALVTPHRAQRSLLQTELAAYSPDPIALIDTVEKLQGDEKPTVIMSATVSDPSAIAKRVEFILDLNRSNVAFSRSKERLIVVCSESLINFIPVEMDHYDSAMLWKSLRSICNAQVAAEKIGEFDVRIFTPKLEI